MDEELKAGLRQLAPPSFQAFVSSLSSPPCGDPADSGFHHIQAEHMEVWAKPEEVDAFLRDVSVGARSLRVDFLQQLTAATMALGQLSLDHAPYPAVCVCPCHGCSFCYDNGDCQHADSPPLVRLPAPLRGARKELAEAVHSALLHMSLAVSLLNWRGGAGAASLLESMSEEAPAGMPTGHWAMNCIASGQGWRCSLPPILGIVDNCCRTFPKAAHTATALLSLIVSRRPSPSLCVLDPEPTCHAIFLLLSDVFPRLARSECLVEMRFGLAHVLEILPLLYHLCDWKEAAAELEPLLDELPAALASLCINILHLISEEEGHPLNSPLAPFLEQHPETLCATLRLHDSLGGDAAPFLTAAPLNFAFAGLLETLARWQRKGIRVSKARSPAAPPPELEAVMSDEEIEGYMESAESMFKEYTPRMVALAQAEPRLAYLLPLFASLAGNTKPELPSMENSLLRGPLRAHSTCGQPGCRRSQAEGGGKLLICQGGCGGLTRYCCREHQREHWGRHKGFCQRLVPGAS
jgi:hypothetical protein